MSGFGYNVLGFGGGGGPTPLAVDEDFNRVSFLSHFDGANNGVNNAFDDGSASNHTMTGVGSIGQGSFGPFARPEGYWGVEFDGVADYIQAAASSDFQLGSGDFTFEMWVFPTDIDMSSSTGSYGGGIIDFREANSATTAFGCHIKADGKIDMYTNTSLAEGGSVTEGVWSHLAWVRISNVIKGYVNGSQVFSFSNSTNWSSGRITIASNIPHNNDFQGSVSNVRVVKGTGVYTGGFTPPTSALTAITGTVLLTCQSNRIVDNSASAHALTASGNTAVSAFGPFLTDAVYDPAVNGASAFFTTGTNAAISTPNSSDFDLGATFTIEAWVYAYTAPDYANICGRWYDGSNDARIASHYIFQLYPDSGGAQLSFGTPLNFNQLYGSAFPTGEWVHVAVTQDGTTKRLFQNGIMGTTYSNPTTMSSSGNRVFSVGAHDGSNAQDGSGFKDFWDGHICDLRVLKGTALYTSNFTPPTAPLTAITNTKLLLNMADGQAIDSAAQNNLVLYGNAKISTGQAKFGDTSMLFDGTGDFVHLNERNDLSGPFTIETWAWADDTTNAFMWCQGQYRIELGINGNTLRMYRTGSATEYTNFFTGGEFSVNTWHHVALVRDTSNVIKCYLNGTASGTTVTDATAFAATGGLFLIGGEYNNATSISHGWDGYLDNFRISDFARYTSNFTAPNKQFPDQGEE